MTDRDIKQAKPDTQPDPKAAEAAAHKAQEKQAKAQADAEAKKAAATAQKEESKVEAKADAKAAAKTASKAAAKTETKAESKKDDADGPEVVAEDEAYTVKAKPELDDATAAALREREAKKVPNFRRHEWWRYKRLGGKHASWRRPRGIHSKARRHFGYRPPVVSVGYRGPAAARGLHPSGFEEVLVYRPDDLAAVDPKTQAARIGGTVGGRKAEAIEKKADELGIRILNRRS